MKKTVRSTLITLTLLAIAAPFANVTAAEPDAPQSRLRGVATLAAAERLNPNALVEGSPPTVMRGFAAAFATYLKRAYPQESATAQNEFAWARLRNRAIADIQLATAELPRALTYTETVVMRVRPYDLAHKQLTIEPPMLWASDYPSLYIKMSTDEAQWNGEFGEVRILLQNVKPGNLSASVDPIAAERFVSLLSGGRAAKVVVRYELVGVRKDFALEARVQSIIAYPDEAKSMSISLLDSARVAVTNTPAESGTIPGTQEVDRAAPNEAPSSSEPEEENAAPAPRRSKSIDGRQAAAKLMLAFGRACEALVVLQGCTDAACDKMARDARDKCQR